MNERPPPAAPRFFWPAILILAAGLAVYATNLRTAFVYDDFESIVDNPHLRTLWPLTTPLTAPPHATLAGRPVVSLTFALNYAADALNIRGYRAVNLAVHLLNALLLLAILRRTLLSPRFAGRFATSATACATAVALIWVVHPLLTEAVVYVVQRTELLVTFFYLLTIYLALRTWTSRHPALWGAAAVIACALGMASKEVMVSAPLFVLIYDATFISDSFAKALRRHAWLYIALAMSWLVQAALIASGPRGPTAGFGLRIGVLDYLRTQAWAICHYLWLCFWPHRLAIYEDVPLIRHWGEAAPYGLVVLLLLGVTLWGLWRRHWIGAAGALFFLVLAPTSSFVPIVTEVVAERRMYLPSAAVITVVVMLLTCSVGFSPRDFEMSSRGLKPTLRDRLRPPLILAVAVLLAIPLAARTVLRIRDYRSETAIWQANLKVYPNSPGTLDSLGAAAARLNDNELAISYYMRSVAESPHDYADPRYNLGNCYMRLGRYDQAIPWYQRALTINATFSMARQNLARCYSAMGQYADARNELEALLRREPDNANAHRELALALRHLGDTEGALAHFTRAAELAPQDADAQNDLAGELIELGQTAKALPHLRDALLIDPDHPIASLTLGRLLMKLGLPDSAVNELQTATRVRPGDPEPPQLLAQAYADTGHKKEAVEAGQEALTRAVAAGKAELAAEIRKKIERYRAGSTQP